MALQAYVIVFSSTDSSNADEVLPSIDELKEAFHEYLHIPNEHVLIEGWPVQIESISAPEGTCRKCGNDVDEGRLFCNECSDGIVASTTEEE